MRNWKVETKNRAAWIKEILKGAKTDGVVYGNSGGKDCALVSYLLKKATDNVVGIMMPCGVMLDSDINDGNLFASQLGIKTITIPITLEYTSLKSSVENFVQVLKETDPPQLALANIKPRLRMTILYSMAQSLNYLVAGTSNRSELFMGYFTKWGDGASDFNPIADLTATEVLSYLDYIGKTEGIEMGSLLKKAPSAGLFEGQTDEDEMGITYKELDQYLLSGKCSDESLAVINNAYLRTMHKRNPPKTY